jgi:exosortase
MHTDEIAVGMSMVTIQKRILLFLIAWSCAAAASWHLLRTVMQFSLRDASASHILLIPFVTSALLLRDRAEILDHVRFSIRTGMPVLIVGVVGLIFAADLSLRTAAFVVLLLGIFLFILGAQSFRKALFPLLFLFLMVPIPEAVLNPVVIFLQKGSAAASAVLFKLTGTPFFQQGFFFALPGVNIEIASECSGIRSSLALCITCLLAGHLMLDKGWKKLVFVLAAIPMAMFKNAVRIVGLSLLAIHVDMSWLTNSRLHHEGGFLFYLLGLILLLPLLLLLRGTTDTRRCTRI